MAKEYIERDFLIKRLEVSPLFSNFATGGIFIKAGVIDLIEKQTAADVVEVRHGYWDDNIFGFCNVCMECGAIVERTAIKNRSGELNYCPNCGAKMDGERRTENGN